MNILNHSSDLMVGAEQIIDDETFDQALFLIKWLTARNVRSQPARHREIYEGV